MKKYLMIFGASFVGSLLIMFVVLWFLGFFNQDSALIVSPPTTEPMTAAQLIPAMPPEDTPFTDPDIINIAAFGLNDGLADTIIVFSYNQKTNYLNMLSIPRDTYHHTLGRDEAWERKINAVYSFKEIGGVLGMKRELSDLLGIPIHHYLKVEFSSVIAIVDTLGGYDVYVPYRMQYDDPYDYPPLHIDIPQGQQHMDGLTTLKFLRFRKSNDGTIAEGDLVRIPRQQAFVSAMINKALDGKLLAVINTMVSGKYISTDMTLDQMISLSSKASTMTEQQQEAHVLPGDVGSFQGLSFFMHDEEATEEMMYRFYNMEKPTPTP
ncbi:MAG: LCP family protein [Bacillota bacterium]|nr:LCP family protein [Bacillota bacterium]